MKDAALLRDIKALWDREGFGDDHAVSDPLYSRLVAALNTPPNKEATMDKVERFDKATCKKVGDIAANALREALAPLGVAVEAKGGRFDVTGAEFLPRFALTLKTVGGVEADRVIFERYCGDVNLRPDHYGATFRVNGKEVRLVGIEPGRGKYPLVVEPVGGGKRFLLTMVSIRLFDRKVYDEHIAPWEGQPTPAAPRSPRSGS
jgi:hypothetical protein